MTYQWYPGHMTKAVRQMQEDIKLIDLIIEIVDARIPLSSRNPDIDRLGVNKARMVLLSKADLADPKVSKEWLAYFKDKGIHAIETDLKKNGRMDEVRNGIGIVCSDKIERDRKRGIKNRPVRAMVVGIPNVGKSTFINAFAGRAVTKTGNKPGVTKGKQWIKPDKKLELLDTPGILWPKFEDEAVGMRLAFVGSINDEIIVTEEMALDLIRYLEDIYPDNITDHYLIDRKTPKDYHILEEIGRVRGCLAEGGSVDTAKAARLLMDDFRAGRLGRMTLECPEDGNE